MKIATLLLTHANPELTTDTVNAITTYVGDRVLVLVDESGWSNFQQRTIGSSYLMKGFFHGHHCGPYRNYALGLQKLYALWPDSDWFLYTEYDCLFTSPAFKEDLQRAADLGAWMVGTDLRKYIFTFPLLSQILQHGDIAWSYYLLGCLQFHHRNFLSRLFELNFFNRFLSQTKDFTKGAFPMYHRWAFEEELWPTLAAHLGGKLYELVAWKHENGAHQDINTIDPKMLYSGTDHDLWRGRFKLYPVRPKPPITVIDMKDETSIAHPMKEANKIRWSQKDKRRLYRKRHAVIF